jgi:hypothetical protein
VIDRERSEYLTKRWFNISERWLRGLDPIPVYELESAPEGRPFPDSDCTCIHVVRAGVLPVTTDTYCKQRICHPRYDQWGEIIEVTCYEVWMPEALYPLLGLPENLVGFEARA